MRRLFSSGGCPLQEAVRFRRLSHSSGCPTQAAVLFTCLSYSNSEPESPSHTFHRPADPRSPIEFIHPLDSSRVLVFLARSQERIRWPNYSMSRLAGNPM